MGINCEGSLVEDIAKKYDSKTGCWPTEYLGVHFFGKPSSITFWQPIIDKIDRRLNFIKKSINSCLETKAESPTNPTRSLLTQFSFNNSSVESDFYGKFWKISHSCLDISWCYLFQNNSNSMTHLFVHCPFANAIWNEF